MRLIYSRGKYLRFLFFQYILQIKNSRKGAWESIKSSLVLYYHNYFRPVVLIVERDPGTSTLKSLNE